MRRRTFIKTAALIPATGMLSGRPENVACQRQALDLSGMWDFRMDPSEVGEQEEWWKEVERFDHSVEVPGSWNAQGMGQPETPQSMAEYEEWLKSKNIKFIATNPHQESEKLYSPFPGPAWYRCSRTVPEEWRDRLIWLRFEGVHRYADVWVNGQFVGSHPSYLTPFKYDITGLVSPGQKVTVVVRVDARQREGDPFLGCFDSLDLLYVRWGGIFQKVSLEVSNPFWIDDVFIIPRIADQLAEFRIGLQGHPAQTESRNHYCVEVSIFDQSGKAVAQREKSVQGLSSTVVIPVPIADPCLWSPEHPHLYRSEIKLVDGRGEMDVVTERFGMREIRVDGSQLLLNDKPIFLRGYGDDCIFPNTICPPANSSEYRHRLTIAKDYGFNYARHHSWFPLREHFEVADELGILMQPEFPIGYSIFLAKTEQEKRFYLDQWVSIIRARRNHPSIFVWCMGNELYDGFDLAPEMYRLAKEMDPTRLVIDSDGVHDLNQIRPTLDYVMAQAFHETTRFGLETEKYELPSTPEKPVLAHEMGYFVSLPDLTQLDLFEQGLRPYWLDTARKRAAEEGVLDLYPGWLEKSCRLQALCLKTNIEAARRSPHLSGYTQWLLQDYPSVAEGVVDMFFRNKYLSGDDFRKFNSPTVLLLDCPRRSFQSGATADLKLLVSRFEDEEAEDALLRWELRGAKSSLEEDSWSGLKISSNGVQALGSIRLRFPEGKRAEQLTLSVQLEDRNGMVGNSWNLWAFPDSRLEESAGDMNIYGIPYLEGLYPWATQMPGTKQLVQSNCDLLISSVWESSFLDFLVRGGRVILLSPGHLFPTEQTRFRPSGWDPEQPGGHVGTVLEDRHPLLEGMPHEGWCDLQFFHMIEGAAIISLQELPAQLNPIIRLIDMPQRLANRAFLFEVKVGEGRLLISGLNFEQGISVNDPATHYFLDQLIRYALGPRFEPGGRLSPDILI